jgi:ribosomal protein S8
MVRISVLNDALKSMFNAEKRGKRQVLIKPSSKVIIKFLSVMQKHGECGNAQLHFLCSWYSHCVRFLVQSAFYNSTRESQIELLSGWQY